MTGLIGAYDAFAVDLDGVVWRGGTMIDGSKEALDAIRASGKPLLLITNNGSHSPALVRERLARAGFAVEEREVLNSIAAAASWLKNSGLWGCDAFIVGTEEMALQLDGAVVAHPVARGTKIDVVIVGRDPGFNYDSLDAAAAEVRRGAILLALNRDPALPVEGGFMPGTGAIVAAIEVASGKDAVVVGKPERPMMDAARELLGPGRVLLVGDRMASDVAGAKSIGWDAALVTSGSDDGVEARGPRPDHVAASLAALLGVQ